MQKYKSHDCAALHWQFKTTLLWKSTFDPYDPKWPQGDCWTHDIDRGCQAHGNAGVLWPSY